MVNGIRTMYPRGFNKVFGSKFRVSSRVRQEKPEEDRRTHQPKCCEYNNQDKDNSSNTHCDLNEKPITIN